MNTRNVVVAVGLCTLQKRKPGLGKVKEHARHTYLRTDEMKVWNQTDLISNPGSPVMGTGACPLTCLSWREHLPPKTQ